MPANRILNGIGKKDLFTGNLVRLSRGRFDDGRSK
jgi:hypothetical protein